MTATASKPWTQEPPVISQPGEPSKVADDFLQWAGYVTFDPDPAQLPTIHARVHHGDFYRWNGQYWERLTEAELTVQVTALTREAVYLKMTKNGPVQVPWNPTSGTVREVVRAILTHPVIQLPATITAPAWYVPSHVLPSVHAKTVIPTLDGMVDPFKLAADVPELAPDVPKGSRHRALYDHSAALWNHHVLQIKYGSLVTKPPTRWLQFLDELWPTDRESIDTLQEVFGYLLSGETHQQKVFMLVGPKRSGKGTIGRVLTHLMGRDAVVSPTVASLSTNFGMAALIDKSLAIIADARVDSKLSAAPAIERLLSVSGEDSQSIDRKYRDAWEGRLSVRFLMLTNEVPRFPDNSGALASRFVVVQMSETFYGREDHLLTEKLIAEAPGILDWALDGLERLSARGYFEQPASAREAIDSLEVLASPISAFVDEKCELDPAASVSSTKLYSAWDSWALTNGHVTGSSALFGRNLASAFRGVHRVRRTTAADRSYDYQGIRLR